MTTFHFNVPLSLRNSCVRISYLDLFSKTCHIPNVITNNFEQIVIFFWHKLISSMIQVEKCLILGTGMLQDVGEAQLGGSLDSLGLQLLLRPETKSYTRFCPGGFPQCPRPASCCWTDHLWGKQSFAEGGDVIVLKWWCWWYTPGVNERGEWIEWWLTTIVRCFCIELNEQMSRLAWNNLVCLFSNK